MNVIRSVRATMLWRLLFQSVIIFVAGLLVGVPSGFFQEELGDFLGWLMSDLFIKMLDCVCVFFICFFCSVGWKVGSVMRSVLSVVAVQVISFCLSIALGTDLPPLLLLIPEILMMIGAAVGGAVAGAVRGRS